MALRLQVPFATLWGWLAKPWVSYSLLALAVLLPMLLPGYILTLDMAFTPVIRMPEQVTASYPFYALLHFLNIVIPSQILQKAMLVAILLLSGLGVHRLVQYLQPGIEKQRDYASWAPYIAGTLYMINPFTYSRFMAGQFAVLLGYALLPFFARAWLRFVARPDMRGSLAVGLWVVAIAIVSIHTLGMAAVLAVGGLGLAVWQHRGQSGYFARCAKYTAASLAVVLALSSYWLLPLAMGANGTARAIRGFSTLDQQAFATTGGSAVNQVFNVLALQGFWAEARGLYALPQAKTPLWILAVLALWVFVATGIATAWKHIGRGRTLWLAASAGIAVVFACSGLLGWMARSLPFLAGYREPHKFVGLVALAFAVFASLGIVALLQRYKARGKAAALNIVACMAVLLPVVLTPTMFWGFAGQLKPREYPADWYAINRYLNTDRSAGRTLLVPWHLYMYFDFAKRTIVNPANSFFDKPVIVSNELEFGGASPTVPDAEKAWLSASVLPHAASNSQFGRQLAQAHIKYVLVAKERDYHKFDYLAQGADFTIVQDTGNFRLYRNSQFGGRGSHGH